MYKVMLADDDYPVLELLSKAIDWPGLGLRVTGLHENGRSAWEQAQEDMPDILITDIGMPELDGLELIARMKERNPSLRIVILSCHDEFQYARQAMRMNVQEYYLKDALDPADLEKQLALFRASLDEEKQTNWEQTRLRLLETETKGLRKEKALKDFVEQPLLSPEQWRREARSIGLLLEGEACLPVIGCLEGYRQAKPRFTSEQTLRFAIGNVLDEVLEGMEPRVQHVGYGVRRSFILFSYRPSLKTNIYEQAAGVLNKVQTTLLQVLKLRMSFIVGTGCRTPEALKQELGELAHREDQRFYLLEGEVAKRKEPPGAADEDLFERYEEASRQLRDILAGKEPKAANEAVDGWIRYIRQKEYPRETVKDWVLKLLLDLKLKLHSLQPALHTIRSSYTADTLHKEIVDIDSLVDLRNWLVGHLEGILETRGAGAASSRRSEVAEACRFVSLNLGRRIGLDEVAEQLHLNASYFSRLFKKEVGITFIEYVTRMKMERAKELLDQTSRTVGEICEMLGYDNQSYFIKTFKGHAGVTPAEYRG
ncbi:response regulator transcription factor [Cohnella fermenti]|uniref:Helix-turn-helix domain-containing protein n=1 Tax=Cohnella fermenti TaxID=2565925 RepID=A0A4S4BJS3_9BACL|nr:helix-turn-helix domain-containing protein [Cohnella fermenti]THF74932.1 helix-turn-helix domain-containing protein [Cohnella fermenti]